MYYTYTKIDNYYYIIRVENNKTILQGIRFKEKSFALSSITGLNLRYQGFKNEF